MSLSRGTRIGIYEIIDLIGAGGMGQVYRARDTRLGRDVAIKVLPGDVAADRERVARFAREARVLATLNHPNIAVIHGLEDLAPARPGETGVAALVMELVDGQTLEDRLRASGPMTTHDALAIADQIAGALDAAHEKGIVHRDLKPANVKITPAGVVKVLDFGLAKIAATDSTDSAATMTLATRNEVILGTPAYMSPEQAQGKPVDRRADIWAFGALLYEMVSGQRPFRGDSVHQTLAAVLTTDPDWDRVPPELQPLLRRCLERDPRRRLRDIGDFRLLIDRDAGRDRSAATPRRRLPLLTPAAIALLALGAFAVWTWRPRAGTDREPVRLTTTLPAGVSVTRGPGFASSVAVSPDGRTIVVAGTSKDGQRLYRRDLDQLELTPIGGTDRGSSPFFSWDGAWIGFAADGKLKRVPANGGAAVDIVPIAGFPAGASWGPDDRIVFAYGAASRLYVVSADGGTAEPMPGVEAGFRPDILPDGRTVLYESRGWIHAFDAQSGRQVQLVQGTAPRFANGYLIVNRGNALMAVAVDLSRYETAGPVTPLIEAVAGEPGGLGGMLHYAVSPSGTLVYVPSASAYDLILVGADGAERVIAEGQRSPSNPQFSPDGTRLVVSAARRSGEPANLWVHELKTGATTQLTFDGGRAPIWTPAGDITYSQLTKRLGIFTQRPDGRGEPAINVALETPHWLVGWTPDRRTLAYGVMEGTPSSIVALTEGQSRRVVGPSSIWGGRLSADGKLLAYYSLDSGTFEVYVTPFPEGGSRWLIAEGTDPAWGRDNTEVYYRSGARLMAARLDTTQGVRALSHRVVVEPFLPPRYDDYDIHPDGRTLVLVRPSGSVEGREVAVVVDWFTELRRRMRAP